MSFKESYKSMSLEDKTLWWGLFSTSLLTLALPPVFLFYFFMKTALLILLS